MCGVPGALGRSVKPGLGSRAWHLTPGLLLTPCNLGLSGLSFSRGQLEVGGQKAPRKVVWKRARGCGQETGDSSLAVAPPAGFPQDLRRESFSGILTRRLVLARVADCAFRIWTVCCVPLSAASCSSALLYHTRLSS